MSQLGVCVLCMHLAKETFAGYFEIFPQLSAEALQWFGFELSFLLIVCVDG